MDAFYLNLFVKNTKELVSAKVDSKVSKGSGFGLFNAGAKALASAMVSDDKVSTGIAAKLCEKVPEAIASMGIEASVDQKWFAKNYVVLRVQVKDVDKAYLLEKAKGKEFADKFTTMLECFEFFDISDALKTADAKISSKVLEMLMLKLNEVLPVKLAENGVEVELTVVPSAMQAEFFFDVAASFK